VRRLTWPAKIRLTFSKEKLKMTVIQSTSSESLARPLRSSIMRWASVAHTVFVTCLHSYRAAAMYEELRKLSPGELERRGFSHANLARDLFGLDDGAPAHRKSAIDVHKDTV
jgi:hypothetical protein